MLHLIQTSKVRSGFGTPCNAHMPTSSTHRSCSQKPAELSIREFGVKGSLEVQDKREPSLSFLLSLRSLFRLEQDHHFQKPALFSLGYCNSTLNDGAKS